MIVVATPGLLQELRRVPGPMPPTVSVVSLNGETILDVPLDVPQDPSWKCGVRAAVDSHFQSLLDFDLVYHEAPEPLTAQLLVRRRIGLHQLLAGLRSMKGSQNVYRHARVLDDDLDKFLGLCPQELYDVCSTGSGYMEMARVIVIWQQLKMIAPTRPLRMVDIEWILLKCRHVDRHSALRTLIGLHNDQQLSLPTQRFSRVCQEVGMTLRGSRASGLELLSEN